MARRRKRNNKTETRTEICEDEGEEEKKIRRDEETTARSDGFNRKAREEDMHLLGYT